MSPREASCPSCGAPLEFRNAATLVVVCESCRTAVYRTDANLEAIGKMPEVAPIDSVVSLGASGILGGRAWHVIGQVQLDHGTGPWNEWCLHFDDGAYAWLAEAQGELILTREVADERPPRLETLRPGTEVRLAGEAYTVVEVRRARVTSARGELPDRVGPGDVRKYADLRGGGGRFATISDDTSDADPPEVFAGSVVTKAALGIDERTVERAAPRRAATDRYACPKCGSPIVLRDPEGAVRFTCNACGDLLERTAQGARVVQEAAKIEGEPRIPLGTKGRIRDLDVEVIAYLVRSVRVDGVRYPWHEYLLRTRDGEYRWLVDAKGHWSFIEPLTTQVVPRSGRGVECGGRAYRHFQGGSAVVDRVLGEMYWACAVGETVRSDDFVHLDAATGEMLQISREGTDAEMVWSRAHYVEPDAVRAAFGAAVRTREPQGVAINQPNRRVPTRRAMWRAFVGLAAAVVAMWIFFHVHHANRVVATAEFTAPPDVATPATPPGETGDAAATRGVVVTEEFDIAPEQSNVVVHLWAAVNQSWVGVDGALVNVVTGDVHAFAVQVERWSGVEGGESWSEGSTTSDAEIGSVARGRYALRMQASSSGTAPLPPEGVGCKVVVRNQVASTGWPFVLLVLLVLPPAFVAVAAGVVEQARWAESDHAGGG